MPSSTLPWPRAWRACRRTPCCYCRRSLGCFAGAALSGVLRSCLFGSTTTARYAHSSAPVPRCGLVGGSAEPAFLAPRPQRPAHGFSGNFDCDSPVSQPVQPLSLAVHGCDEGRLTVVSSFRFVGSPHFCLSCAHSSPPTASRTRFVPFGCPSFLCSFMWVGWSVACAGCVSTEVALRAPPARVQPQANANIFIPSFDPALHWWRSTFVVLVVLRGFVVSNSFFVCASWSVGPLTRACEWCGFSLLR